MVIPQTNRECFLTVDVSLLAVDIYVLEKDFLVFV